MTISYSLRILKSLKKLRTS